MDFSNLMPFEIFQAVQKYFYETPLQYHFLEYSLLQLLGDCTGKSVLDLGCEVGYYSRMIRSKGAAKVTAVDSSAETTEMGRYIEGKAPQGIDYFTCDIADFRSQERFDVVIMVESLNAAKSVRHLQEMLRVAYHHTAPGGRLVAILSHRQESNTILEFPNLGLSISCTNINSVAANAQVKLSLKLLDQPPSIETYTLFDKIMIEQCLKNAKYRTMEWWPCSVSPHCGLDEKYWGGLAESRFFMGLTCLR